MVTTTLLLLGLGLAPVDVEPAPHHAALRVRAYADAGVDPALLPCAQQRADALLASAGLTIVWRLCGRPDDCPLEQSRIPEIVVVLSSRNRPKARQDCGLAALGARAGEGTVTVSVPCVADVSRRLASRLATRSHPLLANPRVDDVVGAAVAHEIGHILGMAHAATGLMRARLESDDIVALRLGQLGFSRKESVRLRAAAQAARDAGRDARHIVALGASRGDRPER